MTWIPSLRQFRPVVATLVLLVAAASPSALGQENFAFETRLDLLLKVPEVFSLTPADLEASFPQPRGSEAGLVFKWLTTDKSRAYFSRRPYANVTNDLTVLDGSVPVEEVIVDFENGRFYGLTVSILNRGDSGLNVSDEFTRRREAIKAGLSGILSARPTLRRANPSRGFLTEGWMWLSHVGMAVLEYNPEAPEQVEFLRLRLTGRNATGFYGAAIRGQSAARVRLTGLSRRVRRGGNGNVYLSGVPMVDQGGKGYCVVASVQRVFEYYGIPCDQHQLAQVSGAHPSRGTSLGKVRAELEDIDRHFNTRFETVAVRFTDGKLYELTNGPQPGREVTPSMLKRTIKSHIDAGIPLLWSLDLGLSGERPLATSRQRSGGHMRLIIGYNDRTDQMIYSDSWGAEHEFRTLSMVRAIGATFALFVLEPATR